MNADPLLGKVIDGRYEVLELLGSGGMGAVYRARHRLLGSDVALKVVRADLAGSAEGRARFLREARAASALSHPGIAAFREVGEFEGRLYMTMDLVPGRSLDRVLREDGPLPADRAAKIAIRILDAVAEAHRHRIVHRDLKPANVMLEPDGRVRVLDFGLAKSLGDATEGLGESLTATGMVVGTARYMAPEQVTGDAVDERTDLYAVAAVLYEMLAGRPPHAAESRHELMRRIVLEEPAPLPGPLGAAALRGLRKEPAARPASAAAFADLIRAAGGEGTGATRAAPRPGREVVVAAPRRRRGGRFLALSLFLAALVPIGWGVRTVLRDREYEAALREGRAALDRGDLRAAATAFARARGIEASEEAVRGERRARFGERKAAALAAEAERRWADAARLWTEASELAETPGEVAADLARAETADRTRPGALVVRTTPPDLEVRLADRPPARSPVRFEGVPGGDAAVLVRAPDGEDRLAFARIRGDAETVLSVDLERLAAEEERRYEELVIVAGNRSRDRLRTLVDLMLAELPGARSTAEILLVRRILDAGAGRLSPPPRADTVLPPALRDAEHFALSPSGRRLLGLYDSRNLFYVLDLPTGTVRGPVAAKTNGALADLRGFALDDRYLWSLGEGGFEWWDLESGTEGRVDEAGSAITHFFSREGPTLLASDWDREQVRGIDPATGATRWTCPARINANYELDEDVPRHVVTMSSGILDVRTGQATFPSFGADGDWASAESQHPRLNLVLLRGSRQGRPRIGVFDLAGGRLVNAFDLPRDQAVWSDLNSLGPELSPDGRSVWSSHDGPGILLRTTVENPSDRTEIPFDPDAQAVHGGYFPACFLVADKAPGGDFDRIRLYDSNTGALVLDRRGSWGSPFVGPLSDEAAVIVEAGLERQAVYDRRTGEQLCDRSFGLNINVAWLPTCGLVWIREVSASDSWQGDLLLDPSASEPFWRGPPIPRMDERRGIALAGGSDRFYTDPWVRRELVPFDLARTGDASSWRDLLTMEELGVDTAFFAALGPARPVRVGPYLAHLGAGGRFRLWRELDLLDALVPWPPGVLLHRGALLAEMVKNS